jgi:hypothetical protein
VFVAISEPGYLHFLSSLNSIGQKNSRWPSLLGAGAEYETTAITAGVFAIPSTRLRSLRTYAVGALVKLGLQAIGAPIKRERTPLALRDIRTAWSLTDSWDFRHK